MKLLSFESVRKPTVKGTLKTFYIINKSYRKAVIFDPFRKNDLLWDRQFEELKDGLIIDGKEYKPLSISGEGQMVGNEVEKGAILEIEVEIARL
jgi:hypothetical protein